MSIACSAIFCPTKAYCSEPSVVRYHYFQIMKLQRAACIDPYPEFDAIGIFREIVAQHSTDFTRGLPAEKIEQLPVILAEAHRAASRFRLQPYPGVGETLRQLHAEYRLAIVSDGQVAYAIPELHAVGLSGYFDPILISGQFGYRKPDERLFKAALAAMCMRAIGGAVCRQRHVPRYSRSAEARGSRRCIFESNQGTQEKEGAQPDYIIRGFPELLDAVRFI